MARAIARRWKNARSKSYQPKPFLVIYLLLLLLGTAGAFVTYLALVNWVPGARSNSLDALKTSLTVVAGTGAAAAIYVSYRKQRNDEANSTREHDRLFTDRFTKASEQLGHDAAAVRLAGMYALARIADDSERDRETCMKVICAYLRMPFDPTAPDSDLAERNVRATALKLLEERLRPSHPHFWKGADVDLSGAYLINAAFARTVLDKAIFSDAHFYGVALFSLMRFGWRTYFERATFHDRVWFGYSEFHDQVTFRGARFLSEAAFCHGQFLDKVTFFDEARFEGAADFSNAKFPASASFKDVHFESAPTWPEGYELNDGKLVRVVSDVPKQQTPEDVA
ncbi:MULTISPECIES: pentapeptide repeat-containing protein [Micromonospora]|uniref:pentapeptide repeat-containing protein n=1 Tax=Micromonospora TaxID=1873 RepID=UPI00131402FA|nr:MULTISPECIES: pentapeptide repeat-containing protein [Micromonospora]WDQ00170.1 pentapeptide repeat-containing protein [Micromonospora chalcea]